MRKRLAILVVILASLSVSPRATQAVSQDCSEVLCGCKCLTHSWDFSGYCNPPADYTIGCVQLYGPDCASMEPNCCKQTGAAASF